MRTYAFGQWSVFSIGKGKEKGAFRQEDTGPEKEGDGGRSIFLFSGELITEEAVIYFLGRIIHRFLEDV